MKCVKFGAEWCTPCKMFEPIFKKVSEDSKYSDITFEMIDISDAEDDEKELISLVGVRNIPCTVILTDDNKIINKKIGSMSQNDFETFIDNSLKMNEIQ